MAWKFPPKATVTKLPRLQRQDALGLSPHKLHIPSKERGACGYHATGPRCRVRLPTRSRVRSRPRSYFTCLDRLRQRVRRRSAEQQANNRLH